MRGVPQSWVLGSQLKPVYKIQRYVGVKFFRFLKDFFVEKTVGNPTCSLMRGVPQSWVLGPQLNLVYRIQTFLHTYYVQFRCQTIDNDFKFKIGQMEFLALNSL